MTTYQNHCARCKTPCRNSYILVGQSRYLCDRCWDGVSEAINAYMHPSFSTQIQQEQDFHAHGVDITEEEEKKMTKSRLQVFTFMQDGLFHTIEDITDLHPNIPPQSVTIYLRSFREKKYGGHTVNRRKMSGKRVFEYQLSPS